MSCDYDAVSDAFTRAVRLGYYVADKPRLSWMMDDMEDTDCYIRYCIKMQLPIIMVIRSPGKETGHLFQFRIQTANWGLKPVTRKHNIDKEVKEIIGKLAEDIPPNLFVTFVKDNDGYMEVVNITKTEAETLAFRSFERVRDYYRSIGVATDHSDETDK